MSVVVVQSKHYEEQHEIVAPTQPTLLFRSKGQREIGHQR